MSARTAFLPALAALLAASFALISTASAGVLDYSEYFFDSDKYPMIVQPIPAVPVAPPGVNTGGAPIEPIPMYARGELDPTFVGSGLEVGDVGPSLHLNTLAGGLTTVSAEQSAERPTLFVTVSLTCPIARDHVVDAERVARDYAGDVDVKLVYVVEAHPLSDPSPYTAAPWPSERNAEDGIFYNQPTTMSERIALALTFRDHMATSLEILVDREDNAWWNTYGPAPNQAVLIAPNGEILLEHGWFNGDLHDIDADLRSILGGAG